MAGDLNIYRLNYHVRSAMSRRFDKGGTAACISRNIGTEGLKADWILHIIL